MAKVTKGTIDIPTRVFEEFINSLAKEGLPNEVIVCLEQKLNDKVFTEAALRSAMFEEEPHDQD